MSDTSNTKTPHSSDEYSSSIITPSYHSTHCPQSHLKLFKCPNFCSSENVCINQEETDRFLKLNCKECNCFWYVCFNCKNQSKHYVSIYQLKRHFYTTCKTKIVGKGQNIDAIVRKKRPKTSVVDSTPLPFQFDVFSKLDLFGRKQNKMFYFYEQFNQGPHYLVGLAHYKLNNIAHMLDTTEVFCHFRLAYLFLTMNPLQSYLQTKILRYFYKYLNPAYNQRRWGCSMPFDAATIRRLYTEGANSIVKQLPHPNVVNVDGHSYVPLSEILQDCLANGNSICDLKKCSKEFNENNVRHISDSKHVKIIINEIPESHCDTDNETIHVMIVRWSDDFEPNNIKKNKGNSIWTMTVTIIGTDNNHQSADNTYIIAIGHKEADHTPIEERFLRDLRNINMNEKNKYYVAYNRKIVNVKVHLIACVADLPERYDTCRISRGNSNYTTRWGYSSNTKLLQNKLRSCADCFESCVRNIEGLEFNMGMDCGECLNWNFDQQGDLTQYPLPAGFPGEYNHLEVHKLSFPEMISACELAETKYMKKQWSSSQLTSYLAYKGIKASLIAKILEHADYNLHSNTTQSVVNERFNLLIEQNLENESLNFVPTTLPPVWFEPYTLKKWIDAPMHLIFLGVVKKTNSIIDKWATLFNKQKTIMKSFASMIPSIYNMKLEWCKIIPLCPNMTFGGYVSENWAAVGRLICWFYQSIPTFLVEQQVDTADPDKPWKQWTAAEIRKWLVLHGLKRSGKISELRQRIAPYLEGNDQIPDIISKYKCPPDVVKGTIVSMYQMISRLMQPKCSKASIKEANAYIHLYLNFLASWTQYIIPSNRKPLWISSYSMLNLLNLPSVMETHGPLRNYWEGSTMGEGILKKVKENYSRMGANWHMSLTKRTLQYRSLHQIHKRIETMEHRSDCKLQLPDTDMFRDVANNYHVYPDFLCVERAFSNGQPLSIIVADKMKLYSVVACDILYEIEIRGYIEECFGLHYYLFKEPKLAEKRLSEIKIVDFGLMLPRLTGSDDFDEMTEESCYTIITSEWKQIDKNKIIKLPQFEMKIDVSQYYTNI